MRDPIRVARLHIYDMLESIDLLRAATSNLTFEDYLKQRIIQLAVERAIEIISEASRRIPDHLKATAPEVPWPKIAGVGNVLRHDYRDIAPRAIWNVIVTDLEPLEAALRKILAQIGEE